MHQVGNSSQASDVLKIWSSPVEIPTIYHIKLECWNVFRGIVVENNADYKVVFRNKKALIFEFYSKNVGVFALEETMGEIFKCFFLKLTKEGFCKKETNDTGINFKLTRNQELVDAACFNFLNDHIKHIFKLNAQSLDHLIHSRMNCSGGDLTFVYPLGHGEDDHKQKLERAVTKSLNESPICPVSRIRPCPIQSLILVILAIKTYPAQNKEIPNRCLIPLVNNLQNR